MDTDTFEFKVVVVKNEDDIKEITTKTIILASQAHVDDYVDYSKREGFELVSVEQV